MVKQFDPSFSNSENFRSFQIFSDTRSIIIFFFKLFAVPNRGKETDMVKDFKRRKSNKTEKPLTVFFLP